jgi:hypothetical protein
VDGARSHSLNEHPRIERLKPNGNYVFRLLYLKMLRFSHAVYLCFIWFSQWTPSFLYTSLIGWFLQMETRFVLCNVVNGFYVSMCFRRILIFTWLSQAILNSEVRGCVVKPLLWSHLWGAVRTNSGTHTPTWFCGKFSVSYHETGLPVSYSTHVTPTN